MNLASIIISIILSCLVCIGISSFIIGLINDKHVSTWLKITLTFLQITIFVIFIIIVSTFIKYSYDADIKRAYYHGVFIKREVHFNNQNNIEKVDTIFYVD